MKKPCKPIPENLKKTNIKAINNMDFIITEVANKKTLFSNLNRIKDNVESAEKGICIAAILKAYAY